MAKRIDRLTDAQAARLPAWRDTWIGVGLSTEPLSGDDRAAIERTIRAMYRAADKPEPRAVIFVPSPLVLRLASGFAAGAIFALRIGWPAPVTTPVETAIDAAINLVMGNAADAAVRTAISTAVDVALTTADAAAGKLDEEAVASLTADTVVFAAVDDDFPLAIRHAVEAVDEIRTAAVGEAAHTALWTAVSAAVDAAVDTAVAAPVSGAVDDVVRDGARTETDPAVDFLIRCARCADWAELTGCVRIGWAAYMSFLGDVCGLELDAAHADACAIYQLAATQGRPYALHPGFAMMSDRPTLLRRNAAGRLHAADGPAIRYRDGWALYAWHGFILPRSHEHLITDRASLTLDDIEGEPNAELRRIALEIFGFERYLAARSARVIASDELYGQPRRLLEIMVRGWPVRIVEVMNGSLEPDGTRRRFHLGAMPGDTPHATIAASYGIDPAHYREAVRT